MSKGKHKKGKRPWEMTTYLGGEWDSPEKVTPKVFENFLRKKWLFGVLAILVLFAAAVMLV